MDFDELRTHPGETREEVDRLGKGILALGQIPEGVCHMCMKEAELTMHQVSYPGSYGQRKICADCKDNLCLAIMRTLHSVRWD